MKKIIKFACQTIRPTKPCKAIRRVLKLKERKPCSYHRLYIYREREQNILENNFKENTDKH